MFLVSTFPARFVDKNIVASSTGFIDGMAYVGATLVGIIIPFLINISWGVVFKFWVFVSIVIASLVLGIHLNSMDLKKVEVIEGMTKREKR